MGDFAKGFLQAFLKQTLDDFLEESIEGLMKSMEGLKILRRNLEEIVKETLEVFLKKH